MQGFTRAMDGLEKVATAFLIAILGIMTLVLFAGVTSRYFLRISLPWVDPVARYGQVWIMLLGAPILLRRGMHIGFDVLVQQVPERLRQWIFNINLVLIGGFSTVMTLQGLKLIRGARYQVIPELQIPFVYVYYMIPVAGVGLMLACIELLLRPRVGSLTRKDS